MSTSRPSWAHRRWRAMGSTAELVVFGVGAEERADAAVDRIAALEASWSRFLPDSDLCRLNRSAGRWCPVPELLWIAVDAARDAFQRTEGRFDPTALGRLVQLGYDRTFGAVDADGPAVASPVDLPSFAAVGLDPQRRAVLLPVGIGLDLGGIGKGLAADLVAAELRAAGAVSISVSLGGDVVVRGPGPGVDAEWPVPVLASTGAVGGTFPLVDEALVQSTTAIRNWRRGGRCLHHIVDPRSGWPAAAGVDTVVVTGPSAALAEALAKAALIAGPVAGLQLLAAAGVDGWLLDDAGNRWATEAVAGDLVGPRAG